MWSVIFLKGSTLQAMWVPQNGETRSLLEESTYLGQGLAGPSADRRLANTGVDKRLGSWWLADKGANEILAALLLFTVDDWS